MHRTSFAGNHCPIARTLEIIGDHWTPLVLRDLHRGITRFDALQSSLGISRKVLTQRLELLLEHGVIERVPYQQHPPRYDYRLTDKGRQFGHVLRAMITWGERWTEPAD